MTTKKKIEDIIKRLMTDTEAVLTQNELELLPVAIFDLYKENQTLKGQVENLIERTANIEGQLKKISSDLATNDAIRRIFSELIQDLHLNPISEGLTKEEYNKKYTEIRKKGIE